MIERKGVISTQKRQRMLNNRIKINYSKCFDFVSQKDIIFMADDKPHNIPEKLTYFYIN